MQATAYVVDAPAGGFQWANAKKQKGFLSFTDPKAQGLICITPTDTENYLKACQAHKILPVTQCSLSGNALFFNCTAVNGTVYSEPLAFADRDFCLSPQDKKRVEERCLINKPFISNYGEFVQELGE